jgi:type III secretion system FlhB-like substrate exporter
MDHSADNRKRDLAFALEYHELVPAPIVIARGFGWQAGLIRERALAAGVPVVRDAELAADLAMVRLGDAIPESCYFVVAALYRFVRECQSDTLGKVHEKLSGH